MINDYMLLVELSLLHLHESEAVLCESNSIYINIVQILRCQTFQHKGCFPIELCFLSLAPPPQTHVGHRMETSGHGCPVTKT